MPRKTKTAEPCPAGETKAAASTTTTRGRATSISRKTSTSDLHAVPPLPSLVLDASTSFSSSNLDATQNGPGADAAGKEESFSGAVRAASSRQESFTASRTRAVSKGKHVGMAELTATPAKFVLLMLWAFVLISTLALEVVTDLFQGGAPQFPLGPTVITTIGLNVLASCMTTALGIWVCRGFRAFQPFVGGATFVGLQMGGYSVLTLAALVKVVLVEELPVHTDGGDIRYGAYSMLGFFSMIAQSMLLYSLTKFEAPVRGLGGSRSRKEAPLLHRLGVSPYWQYTLIAVACAAIVGTSAVAELQPGAYLANVASLFLFSLLAYVLTHGSLAPRFLEGYPFHSASRGTFWVQLVSGGLIAGTLCLVLVLFYAGRQRPPSMTLSCGLLTSAAIIVQVLMVRMAGVKAARQEAANSPTKSGSGGGGGLTLSYYIPSLASSITTLLAAIVYGIVLLRWTSHATMASLSAGLSRAQDIVSLFLFLLPCVSHLQGRLMFGRRYNLWQPFSGTEAFQVLQAAGWAFFSLGLFFAVLHQTEASHDHFLVAHVTFLLLSQLFLHASLRVFAAPVATTPASAASSSSSARRRPSSGATTTATAATATPEPAAAGEEAEVEPSALQFVLNHEMLLALVLAAVSFLLLAVCDATTRFRGPALLLGGSGIPVSAMRLASTVLSMLATPVATFSLRGTTPLRDVLSNRCSGGFVGLMTLGWFMYGFLAVVTALPDGEKVRVGARDEDYGLFRYLSGGLLYFGPLLCVTAAAVLESTAVLARRRTAREVRDAAHALRRLMRGSSLTSPECEDAEALLWLVAAPGLALCPAVVRESAADPAAAALRQDEDARSEAARYTAVILAVGCFTAFLCAGHFGRDPEHPTLPLLFTVLGHAVLSLGVLSLHYTYGMLLHGARRGYAFFMPFSGGSRFTLYQMVGWCCYTTCSVIVIVCLIEGAGSTMAFSLLALLSVAAIAAITRSVPFFEAQKGPRRGFLVKHAEGVLSAITLFGALVVSQMHTRLGDGTPVAGSAESLASVVVCSLCACVGVPLGLLSLRRNAQLTVPPIRKMLLRQSTTQLAESLTEERGASATGCPKKRSPMLHYQGARRSESMYELRTPSTVVRPDPAAWSRPSSPLMASSGGGGGGGGAMGGRLEGGSPVEGGGARSSMSGASMARAAGSSAISGTYAVALLLAIFAVTLLPFAVVFVFYSFNNHSASAFSTGMAALRGILVFFAVLVLVPMCLGPMQRGLLRDVHSALCTFAVYSIPTITVLSGLTPPVLFHTRGAWLFAFNMCSMALLSTLPHVHLIAHIFTLASFAFFVHYHIYMCLYAGLEAFSLKDTVVDLGCAVFWVVYVQRYRGRPHHTGRYHSTRLTRFFQNHFFVGMCTYFSSRVIVTEPYLLPDEVGILTPTRVDRSDPENQYIFSFHTHGVFPGTAIFIPKTKIWEEAVGNNDKTFISTHCADVVFSVPIMREFPLCLGAMSVSRKGIQNSLDAGNSPLIVTGGQAEMLLTKMSDTEMHMVCHHRGFLRVSMKNKVPVVPMLSFTEGNIMDNVHCISVQQWFQKLIGFAFPIFPIGRWYLPLPTARPVTIVLGQPIVPLPGRDDPDNPEHLEEMRVRYFQHVEVLFYRYRAEAGYPNMLLYFHDGVDANAAGVLAPPP